jgi:hypothetical protein
MIINSGTPCAFPARKFTRGFLLESHTTFLTTAPLRKGRCCCCLLDASFLLFYSQQSDRSYSQCVDYYLLLVVVVVLVLDRDRDSAALPPGS